jgi:hypothetical protein
MRTSGGNGRSPVYQLGRLASADIPRDNPSPRRFTTEIGAVIYRVKAKRRKWDTKMDTKHKDGDALVYKR